MHPKLTTLLYGVGVFIVFSLLVITIRHFTSVAIENYEYFGLFSKKDIFLGLIVAVVVTFNHERKKNLK